MAKINFDISKRLDITVKRGDSFKLELTLKDSSNNPIDLTGHQGRMQIKNTAGGSVTHLTLSSSLGPCGSGLNFSGSSGLLPTTSGTIGVIISSATSSLLNFDQAVYDLEIASGSGDCAVVTRLIEGNIKLIKEVTTGSYV